MKLYYVDNDRRVEYKSLGFKGFFIIFYNLYNLKKKDGRGIGWSDLCYRNSLVLFVDSPFWQCHAEAKPVLHLWNSIGTGFFFFFFFLIVSSNQSPVWLMKLEVNWQGNCDQVICITQLDTLNYCGWFVIRFTVSMMKNAASICLSLKWMTAVTWLWKLCRKTFAESEVGTKSKRETSLRIVRHCQRKETRCSYVEKRWIVRCIYYRINRVNLTR